MDLDPIVTVEHASNHIPEGVELGVDPLVFQSHVAWDPGTAAVGRILSENLGAPLLLGTATRLVADLNRSPHNPEAVPEIAFGVPIPGNQGLTETERADRLARHHTPYWKMARDWVRARIDRRPVLHLSIHSFTPVLDGELRSMSVGIMYDPSRPLEVPLARAWIAALRDRGIETADNGPYDGRNDALTTALRREFPADRYVAIQIEHNLKHMPAMGALGEEVLAALQPVLAGRPDGGPAAARLA